MEFVCAVSIGTISAHFPSIPFFPHPLTEPHNHSLNDKAELKDLTAVEKLKQPQFNITARDIQSSVEAYLANGLEYTAEDMTSRLEIWATLPPDQQWFVQGAAGEGTFTIPVCDVGKNTEWMGRGMPSCLGKFFLFSSLLPSSEKNVSADGSLVLGIGSKDTKSFMESAKMGSFNPVEKKCKNICPVCQTADYGNDTSPMWKPSWMVLAGVFFRNCANFFA